MERKFRAFAKLCARIVGPLGLSASKRQMQSSALRKVVAVATMCAILLAPVMLGGGIHVISHELEAVGASMAWVIGGTIIVGALCGGLAGPAAIACATVMAA